MCFGGVAIRKEHMRMEHLIRMMCLGSCCLPATLHACSGNVVRTMASGSLQALPQMHGNTPSACYSLLPKAFFKTSLLGKYKAFSRIAHLLKLFAYLDNAIKGKLFKAVFIFRF